ncbi:CACTA transposable element [Tanacetum coccineum]
MCNTSIWKDSNTPGKKVPKKVLRYFPIIPRLQRLYKSSHTAKEMTWHATGKCTEPGKMQHPVDGRAWKNFDTKYPDFAKKPRNIRLGLAVDGFNPFGNLSQSYNMWPVTLTTYNLPLWLCMKESSFMLTLLIPGPKSLGKDIDVYLRPLIDDLKDLWAKLCVKTIDIRQRHVEKDPCVSASSDLFTLACGPTPTPISVNSCVVNGVRGVIVVEDDPDIIHVDNSSDLALSTSLNDLEITALHIDGQSIDVDAPPDIIDVDEDDDIIDDEDVLPHDLVDYDDEDLVNVDDDDDGVAMSADVARGHGGDGGGDDRPPPHQIVGSGRDREGVPDALWFLAQHPSGAEGGGRRKIGTQFDLKPHMQFELWPKIRKGVNQHLGKIYTNNKLSLKKDYWVKN